MDPILLNALTGTASATISAVIAWFLSKRKYYSEVDSTNIKNMQESLQFYITLSDDYKQRLDEEIKSHKEEVLELRNENKEVRRELKEQEKKFNDIISEHTKELNLMKNQMLSMYGQVCMKFNCIERMHINEETHKHASSKKSKTLKDKN